MHVYPQINNEPRNNSDSKIQPNQTWSKEDLYWMVAELGFTRQTKLVVDCTYVVNVLVELVGDIQAITEHDHPWKCTKQTVCIYILQDGLQISRYTIICQKIGVCCHSFLFNTSLT